MWKDIEQFEARYQISNCGKVRNCRTLKLLTPKLDRDGYHQIGLRKLGDRKKYWFAIHRLVGLAFLPKSELTQIDHVDHNKLNNLVENLRWTTVADNNLNRQLKAWRTNGTKELYITKYKNGYMIRINRADFKRKTWCKTLEDAIETRNEYLEEIKNI